MDACCWSRAALESKDRKLSGVSSREISGTKLPALATENRFYIAATDGRQEVMLLSSIIIYLTMTLYNPLSGDFTLIICNTMLKLNCNGHVFDQQACGGPCPVKVNETNKK